MTDHSRAKEMLGEIVAGLEGVTPGPWQHQNGCSWHRIGAPHLRFSDGTVFAPTIAPDGHPDLTCGPGQSLLKNLEYIARCDPDTMKAIAAYTADLERKSHALDEVNKLVRKQLKLNVDTIYKCQQKARALKAENERLREALKSIIDGVDCQPGYIRAAGLRLAREALKQEGEDGAR